MARRRYLPPDVDLVHVSFKCVGDAFLMRPDARSVYLVAIALAEALEKYGVRLHAVVILSNHGHLLLGVARCRLDSFMQYLKSRVALHLNVERVRDGAFFKRRYRAEPILSDDAAIAIMQYVHQQPVKHELTERATEWPGLSSFASVIDGKPTLDVAWLDEIAWREAGARRREIAHFTHSVSIPLTPLPCLQGLSELKAVATRRALAANMRDFESETAAKRRGDGSRRLPKPSSYTTQDPNGVPAGKRRKAKTPQPWAHGSEEQVREYRHAYSVVMGAYELASARYRETGILGPFPEGTFRHASRSRWR